MIDRLLLISLVHHGRRKILPFIDRLVLDLLLLSTVPVALCRDSILYAHNVKRSWTSRLPFQA